MGQIEVLDWLKTQYECGQTQFFTVKEIEKGLQRQGKNSLAHTRMYCIKLAISKIIEVKDLDTTGFNNYKRVFRYGKQKL